MLSASAVFAPAVSNTLGHKRPIMVSSKIQRGIAVVILCVDIGTGLNQKLGDFCLSGVTTAVVYIDRQVQSSEAIPFHVDGVLKHHQALNKVLFAHKGGQHQGGDAIAGAGKIKPGIGERIDTRQAVGVNCGDGKGVIIAVPVKRRLAEQLLQCGSVFFADSFPDLFPLGLPASMSCVAHFFRTNELSLA